MKKLLWLASAGCVLAVTVRAQEPFSRRVTADEFQAAGLAKLSPEELARLDALFGKYRSNVPTATLPPSSAVAPAALATPSQPAAMSATESAAARQAEIDAAATKQAEVRVAEAEARARKAEQEAATARAAAETAKAEQKKTEEGFFARAKKVLVKPGTKVEVEALETEIDGAFTGWDEGTVWRMKDGSIWRVDNKPAPLQAKRALNPKVRIYPASLSGYWLEFVDLDYKLRVRPLK
jgi:hypothetical protein